MDSNGNNWRYTPSPDTPKSSCGPCLVFTLPLIITSPDCSKPSFYGPKDVFFAPRSTVVCGACFMSKGNGIKYSWLVINQEISPGKIHGKSQWSPDESGKSHSTSHLQLDLLFWFLKNKKKNMAPLAPHGSERSKKSCDLLTLPLESDVARPPATGL